MRVVVQRVARACVRIGGDEISRIDEGLLAFVGVSVRDGIDAARTMAVKVSKLRIFPDEAGVMNRSVRDLGGAVMAVSQFTLLGDARKGNRPSYIDAAAGEAAHPIYAAFCDALRGEGVSVSEGVFGADMDVELINRGPVTILLDSEA